MGEGGKCFYRAWYIMHGSTDNVNILCNLIISF